MRAPGLAVDPAAPETALGPGFTGFPGVRGQSTGTSTACVGGAIASARENPWSRSWRFDADSDGLSDGPDYPGASVSTWSRWWPASDALGDAPAGKGWDVNVIFEKTKERDTPQSRHVFSDPTVPDTDHDGIDDFNEFQNFPDAA